MRLSDRTLRRLAWAVVAWFVAAMGIGSLVLWGHNTDADGTADDVGSVLFGLMVTLFPVVGLLIIRQQPRNRIGWLLLAIGFAWGMSAALELYVEWALVLHPGSLPGGYVVQTVASSSWLPPIMLMGVYLILLFPDGRLPSPRWRPLAVLAAAVIVVGTLSFTFAPGPVEGEVPVPGVENPIGVGLLDPVSEILTGVSLVLIPVCILGAAWALVRRFRRSRGVERLQLKWLASAGALIAVLLSLSFLASIPPVADEIGESAMRVVDTVSILSFGLIPIAIGIAVTRHGLYGIDVIISRALVVGMLGVFITGVYVGIVVGVGRAIGERQPSVALSVVATAIVAVAFQPVRERVHSVANRLVYGTRTTPYEVLSDFASRMAGTYTASELLPQLARVVGEGVGAVRVEVWWRSGVRWQRQACWPATDEPESADAAVGAAGDVPPLPGDRVVPVRHQDDLLGLITVTKAAGEPVTPSDDRMLAAVASQAGLVLRNVRLIDDLRSSRERLVTTQDDERRRLERNLHDGAQQSLVSVALLTRMAAARASDEHLRASLTEAAAQLQLAIEELRELARGIHPAILTERGLGPALTSLAERSAVPVEVQNDLSQRLPEAVERTLYFVVAEALTNVAKYADASSATVSVTCEGGRVLLEVVDDGAGGADATRGSGLRGLADRLAVVDGSLHVDSPPGEGTRLSCTVPLTSAPSASLEPVS